MWWALCKGSVQLCDALSVCLGCVVDIVRPVVLSRCRGVGLLRGAGNYGRYRHCLIHHEHHWVVGKHSYAKVSSVFSYPWYAPRVAMGGMSAMVARVVFLRGRDVGALRGKVDHCRRQPGMRYHIRYWTAVGYFFLHSSNLISFSMHCGYNRSKWLGETIIQG